MQMDEKSHKPFVQRLLNRATKVFQKWQTKIEENEHRKEHRRELQNAIIEQDFFFRDFLYLQFGKSQRLQIALV